MSECGRHDWHGREPCIYCERNNFRDGFRAVEQEAARLERERDEARTVANGVMRVRADMNDARARIAALEGALSYLLAEVDGGPDYGQSGPDTPGQTRARAALAAGGPPRCQECDHDEAAHGMRSTTCGVAMCLCHGWKPARPAPAACTCGVIQGSRTSSQTHAPDCPARKS